MSLVSSDSAEKLPVSICKTLTLSDLSSHLRALTPVRDHADLVGHPSPMLRSLDHDTAVAYAAAVAFKDCTARFNIPVEKVHCMTWAEDLIEDHPDLKAIEIRRIIKHMSKGQVYNRIDVNVLHTATERYMQERNEAMAAERERRHQQVKAQPVINTSGAPDWFRQRTQEVERMMATQRNLKRAQQDEEARRFREEQKRLQEELKGLMDNEIMNNE